MRQWGDRSASYFGYHDQDYDDYHDAGWHAYHYHYFGLFEPYWCCSEVSSCHLWLIMDADVE